jgi:hypothetical protein
MPHIHSPLRGTAAVNKSSRSNSEQERADVDAMLKAEKCGTPGRRSKRDKCLVRPDWRLFH